MPGHNFSLSIVYDSNKIDEIDGTLGNLKFPWVRMHVLLDVHSAFPDSSLQYARNPDGRIPPIGARAVVKNGVDFVDRKRKGTLCRDEAGGERKVFQRS